MVAAVSSSQAGCGSASGGGPPAGARLAQPGEPLDAAQLLVELGHRRAEVGSGVLAPDAERLQIGGAKRAAVDARAQARRAQARRILQPDQRALETAQGAEQQAGVAAGIARQALEPGAERHQRLEPRHQQLEHPVARRQTLEIGGLDLQHRLVDAPAERAEQRAAAAELAVDDGGRDAGAARHPDHREPPPAVLREQREGGGEKVGLRLAVGGHR